MNTTAPYSINLQKLFPLAEGTISPKFLNDILAEDITYAVLAVLFGFLALISLIYLVTCIKEGRSNKKKVISLVVFLLCLFISGLSLFVYADTQFYFYDF